MPTGKFYIQRNQISLSKNFPACIPAWSLYGLLPKSYLLSVNLNVQTHQPTTTTAKTTTTTAKTTTTAVEIIIIVSSLDNSVAMPPLNTMMRANSVAELPHEVLTPAQ